MATTREPWYHRAMKTPKRHYEAKLSLYPMKFEDAVKAIAKAKPELKKQGRKLETKMRES